MEIVSCSLLEVQNDIQLKFKECSNKQIELAHKAEISFLVRPRIV